MTNDGRLALEPGQDGPGAGVEFVSLSGRQGRPGAEEGAGMQTSGATTAQAVLASNELLADWLEDFARGCAMKSPG